MDLNKTYDVMEDEFSEKENGVQFNGNLANNDDTVNTLIDQLQVLNLGKAPLAVKKKFNLNVWSTPLKSIGNIKAPTDTETNFGEETWTTPPNVANERNVGKKHDVDKPEITQNTRKKFPHYIEFVSSGEHYFDLENIRYLTTNEGCDITLEESTNYEDTTKDDKSFCLGETFANKMWVECSDNENKYVDDVSNISLKIYEIQEETAESFSKQDEICPEIKSELNSASNTANPPKTLSIKKHLEYDYCETVDVCSVDSCEVNPKMKFTTEDVIDKGCPSAKNFENVKEICESDFDQESVGFSSNDYKIVHEEIMKSEKQVDSLISLKETLVNERVENSSSSVKQQEVELGDVNEIDEACSQETDTFWDAEEIFNFSTNDSEQVIEDEITFASDKSRILENELFLQDSKAAKDEEFPPYENPGAELSNSSENELELHTVVDENDEFYDSYEKMNEEPARERDESNLQNEAMDEQINKNSVKQKESVTKNVSPKKDTKDSYGESKEYVNLSDENGESTYEILLKEDVFIELQPPNEERTAPCKTLLLSESYLLEEETSSYKAHIGDYKTSPTMDNNFIIVNTQPFSPEEEIVDGTYEPLFCLDNTELNLSSCGETECSKSSVSSLLEETSSNSVKEADFCGSHEVDCRQVVSENVEEGDRNESVVSQDKTKDAEVDKLPPIDEIFRYCLSQNFPSSEKISHAENENSFLQMCQNFPIKNGGSADLSIRDDQVVQEMLKLSIESENRSFGMAATSLTVTDNIEFAQSCDRDEEDIVKVNNSYTLLLDENVEFSSKDQVPEEQREIFQIEASTLPERENFISEKEASPCKISDELDFSNVSEKSYYNRTEDIAQSLADDEEILKHSHNCYVSVENCGNETSENPLECYVDVGTKDTAQSLLTVDDNSVKNENSTIEISRSNLRSPSCVEILETKVTNSGIRQASASGKRINEKLDVSLRTENCTIETCEKNLKFTSDVEFFDSHATSLPSEKYCDSDNETGLSEITNKSNLFVTVLPAENNELVVSWDSNGCSQGKKLSPINEEDISFTDPPVCSQGLSLEIDAKPFSLDVSRNTSQCHLTQPRDNSTSIDDINISLEQKSDCNSTNQNYEIVFENITGGNDVPTSANELTSSNIECPKSEDVGCELTEGSFAISEVETSACGNTENGEELSNELADQPSGECSSSYDSLGKRSPLNEVEALESNDVSALSSVLPDVTTVGQKSDRTDVPFENCDELSASSCAAEDVTCADVKSDLLGVHFENCDELSMREVDEKNIVHDETTVEDTYDRFQIEEISVRKSDAKHRSSLNEKEVEKLTSGHEPTLSSTEISKSEHVTPRDERSLTGETTSSSSEKMEILDSNDLPAPCPVPEEVASVVRRSVQFGVCLEDRDELSTTCAVNEEDIDRWRMLHDETTVELTCEFSETRNRSLSCEKETSQNEILSSSECTVAVGEHRDRLSITNDARSRENKEPIGTVVEEHQKECTLSEDAMLFQNDSVSGTQEPAQCSHDSELTPEDGTLLGSVEMTAHSGERSPERCFGNAKKCAQNTSPCGSEASSETDSVSSVIENPEYSMASRKSMVGDEPAENPPLGPERLELTGEWKTRNENILSPFVDVKFEMPTRAAYVNSTTQIPGTPLGPANSAHDRSSDDDLLLRSAKVAKIRENFHKFLTPLRDNLVRFRTPRADTRPLLDASGVEIPNRNYCEDDRRQTAKLVFEFPTNLLDLSIDVLESLTAVNHVAYDQAEVPKTVITEERASFVKNDETAESRNIPEHSSRLVDIDVVAEDGTPIHQSPMMNRRSLSPKFSIEATLKTELEQVKSKYEESQKEYEKLADITQVLYHNETSLKQTLSEMDDCLLKSENKYQLLKEYANDFIMQLNVTIEEKDLEIERLQGELQMLKDSKNN